MPSKLPVKQVVLRRFQAVMSVMASISLSLGLAVTPAQGSAPSAAPAAPSADVETPGALSLQLVAPAGKQPSTRPVAVEVLAVDAAGLGAWEFDLDYDPAFVEVTAIAAKTAFGVEANCDRASMRCAVPLGPFAENGTASVGAVSYGTPAAVSGNAAIATLTLAPKGKQGVTTISMRNVMATNAAGAAQSVTGGSAQIEFGAGNFVYLPVLAKAGAALNREDTEYESNLAALAERNSVPPMLRAAAPAATVCVPYDINCDLFIDIRDLQPMANLIGSQFYSLTLDLDQNGVIDAEDLVVNAGGWHSQPENLAGGPPRLGYAVNPGGDVFLRWSIPITPYVAPVFVLRQDISGTTVSQPRVIGIAKPITDETTAMTLLGSDWITVSQLGFTTDISGVTAPYTFTSIAEMHASFAAGRGNQLALSQLINSKPNVAAVFGRGFMDFADNACTLARGEAECAAAIYKIRVKGKIVGPVLVNRSTRTQLKPPRNLDAFEAVITRTLTGGLDDKRREANQQRFAHETIFLNWKRPAERQFYPVWMNGYNVYRSSCAPANLAACNNPANFGKINSEPVQPRNNAPATTSSVPITTAGGASIKPADPVSEINFAYADSNLVAGRMYCYVVAARDLLGQPGEFSEPDCHIAPDFRGPEAPKPVFVGASEVEGDACDVNLTVAWARDQEAVRWEVWRGKASDDNMTKWKLVADVTEPLIAISDTVNFNMSGGYVFTRYNPLNDDLVIGLPQNAQWNVRGTFNPLARADSPDGLLLNRMVITGAHQTRPTLSFTPTQVLTGVRSHQSSERRGGFNLRNTAWFVDTTVKRGKQYRYRIVPFDADGNMGAPSAPAELLARQEAGTCLPAAPQFGQPVNDPEAEYVSMYRKFGSAGQPVLISRVPVTVWNSSNMTITDFYSPTVDMEVSYELRAENGYGEFSLPGALRSRLLIANPLLAAKPAQPMIIDASISKQNNGKVKASVEWSASGMTALNAFNIYMSKGITMPTSYLSMTLVASDTAKNFEITKTTVYSDPTGTFNLTTTSRIFKHSFTNDDYTGAPRLNGKDPFWFMIASRTMNVFQFGGGIVTTPKISSTQRVAVFVSRVDEPQRELDEFNLSLATTGGNVRLDWTKESATECCYVIMRSRNGQDWAQLTPPFSTYSLHVTTNPEGTKVQFVDDDPSLGDEDYVAIHDDTVQYQVLRLDAGRQEWLIVPLNSYNHTGSSGEIVAASNIVTYTRVGAGMPGNRNIDTPATPQPGHPGPDALVFGANGSTRYTVEVISAVQNAINCTPVCANFAFTGTGRVQLNLNGRFSPQNPVFLNPTWVEVQFQDVRTNGFFFPGASVTRTVESIGPTGYANVGLGNIPTGNNNSNCYRMNVPGENKYLLCDVRLDETGLIADKLKLVALGDETVLWDVDGTFEGFVDTRVFDNQLLDSNFLDFTKSVTPAAQNCTQSVDTNVHMVSHLDWPILIVPTGPLSYTNKAVNYSNVCTRYRSSRYSDRDIPTEQAGLTPYEPTDGGNLLENHGFLEPVYTANKFTNSAVNGFSGTLNHNNTFSYSLAFPFRTRITGGDWRVRFENGKLVSGHIQNGSLRMPHSTNGTHNGRPTFDATFTQLNIITGGAIVGAITGTNALEWATFSFTGTNVYDLYLPQALPKVQASLSWQADRGNANSGLGETNLNAEQTTHNAGVNVFKRGLVWDACTADGDISSTGTMTFTKTPNSGFKLYFRYGGASGQVNMTWGGGSRTVDLAGYSTDITRFSQSWLDNQPQVGSTLGDLFLPFPVSMTLEMIGMTVNGDGCMQGGPVLPLPGTLDWWKINLVPSAAEWRTENNGNTNLWLLGEYEIPNLTRVDGVVNGSTLDDPTVPVEVAFKPNGDFFSANAYPQPTVYEVDGFYSVIEEFKLSECNAKKANGTNAGRNEVVARCDGPTGASPWNSNFTFRPSPTATNMMSAYVDIKGSMVLPWVGEVITPSANHIYLLHRANYIGFNKRPKLEGALSAKLPIGIELDNLAFAQGKDGKDGAWIGFSKQGDQRTQLAAFETAYAAIITPDNTTLVFGFPALAAAALAAQSWECDWDSARCGDGTSQTTYENTKWSGFRGKLAIGDGDYGNEWTDAKKIAVAAQDQVGTLSAYNLLAAIHDDMCGAGSECTEEQVSAWITANANSSGNLTQRSPLLRNVMSSSPLQLKWIRGSLSIIGERDNSGKLIGGKPGVMELDSYITIFNRPTLATASESGTTPMFDALVYLRIDAVQDIFKIEVDGIDIKLVGSPATMNLDLEVYMGGEKGHGVHGSIELLNLHFELMDIDEADADFGFTVLNGDVEELYLGITFDARVQTGAFGRILVGGQVLVGRLDPSHETLQEDFGDLFDDMNVSPGQVIEGMYLSVYANNIPIVNMAGCVVAELSGGGGLAFWVFTDPAQQDTAWGTRVSGFVQGQGGLCLVSLAANVSLQLDNGFGEDETEITGKVFVAGGCGFCEPEEWITERGYEDDKGCIKCGLDLGFVIPLDGSPAPYMNPEPSFSCSL